MFNSACYFGLMILIHDTFDGLIIRELPRRVGESEKA